jgi:hypothetical protein
MMDRKATLGTMGEKIVSNYYSRAGNIVEHSIDPYDSHKDLLVDGKKVEVKTQTRFVMKDCFTLKLNQIKKCINGFYIVECPTTASNESSLYKVDKGFRYNTGHMNNGDVRYEIPRQQPAVKKLADIEGKEKMLLRKYSTNYVRTKRLP